MPLDILRLRSFGPQHEEPSTGVQLGPSGDLPIPMTCTIVTSVLDTIQGSWPPHSKPRWIETTRRFNNVYPTFFGQMPTSSRSCATVASSIVSTRWPTRCVLERRCMTIACSPFRRRQTDPSILVITRMPVFSGHFCTGRRVARLRLICFARLIFPSQTLRRPVDHQFVVGWNGAQASLPIGPSDVGPRPQLRLRPTRPRRGGPGIP